MRNTDELPDAELDDKFRELLKAISREQVSPRLLDLAKQLQAMLDCQLVEMTKPE